MAKYWQKRGHGGGSVMTKALGRMVGLLLSLYVFNAVIAAIEPTINVSSNIFFTSVTFVNTLFPVVGILGAFEIIYSALKKSGMM